MSGLTSAATMKLMSARLSRAFAFRQAANGAQAFGHDAQALAKYQCQSHTRIFGRDAV
jgi:hypothetical protein